MIFFAKFAWNSSLYEVKEQLSTLSTVIELFNVAQLAVAKNIIKQNGDLYSISYIWHICQMVIYSYTHAYVYNWYDWLL